MAYATIDELAAALRITVTAANQDALQACLDAAAVEMDDAMSRRFAVALPAAAWLFDSATAAADPGTGELRFDRTSPPAVTELYMSATTADGATAGLAGLLVGDHLVLEDTTGAWEQFVVDDLVADNTGWFTVPVDHEASSTAAATPRPRAPVDGQRLNLTVLRANRIARERLALANRVNIVRGVEWFKANDAAFGVIGFADTGALQAPRNTFARHAVTLLPLKEQFGVA